jgi:hypothetical protein
MSPGSMIVMQAFTLYVCASALFCVGLFEPMEFGTMRVAARLVGFLFLLATLLLLTGLAVSAIS